MHKAVLIRLQQSEQQTLGQLILFSGNIKVFECKTLELPWRGNARNISRIPAGTYKVALGKSPRYGEAFRLAAVPGRSHILIHEGNFYDNTKGCILVGAEFKDIDHDGIKDLTASLSTVNALKGITKEFILQIIDNEVAV